MADSFRKKKPVSQTTPFLLGMAWRAEKLRSWFTGKKPIITRESAKVAQSKTYFENAKFLKTFPQFSFTPLEQTIQKACEKYPLTNSRLIGIIRNANKLLKSRFHSTITI